METRVVTASLLKHDFFDTVAQIGNRDAQRKPKQRIGQTNLPVKIHRLIGVVPYPHMQPFIDNTTHRKFNCRYHCGTPKTFSEQRHMRKTHTHGIDKRKADAARDRHGPMRESAPHNFQQAVPHRSDAKHGKKFFCFQFFHPPRISFPVFLLTMYAS